MIENKKIIQFRSVPVVGYKEHYEVAFFSPMIKHTKITFNLSDIKTHEINVSENDLRKYIEKKNLTCWLIFFGINLTLLFLSIVLSESWGGIVLYLILGSPIILFSLLAAVAYTRNKPAHQKSFEKKLMLNIVKNERGNKCGFYLVLEEEWNDFIKSLNTIGNSN